MSERQKTGEEFLFSSIKIQPERAFGFLEEDLDRYLDQDDPRKNSKHLRSHPTLGNKWWDYVPEELGNQEDT